MPLIKMSLFFITGYTQHGKDTFFKSLSTQQYDFIPQVPNHRIAFADFLKEEVVIFLHLPLSSLETIKKDEVIQDGLSFRDYCISISSKNKENNKYYYCEKVQQKILSLLKQNENVFITDWRFKEELEYFTAQEDFSPYKIVTIRVFRPNHPIPDINIVSEHSLDDISVDYFLINDKGFINSQSIPL